MKNVANPPPAPGASPMGALDATPKMDPIFELKLAMRKLWEDHIVYTRNYIISALAELADVGAIANRLLKNQDDIGNAIKPLYSDDAGNKLSALLRDHILIATEVVKAGQGGNKEQLTAAQSGPQTARISPLS